MAGVFGRHRLFKVEYTVPESREIRTAAFFLVAACFSAGEGDEPSLPTSLARK